MSTANEVSRYLANLDSSISEPPSLDRTAAAFLDRAASYLTRLGRFQWRPVGSAYAGTSVRGYSDLDMLALFTDPVWQALTALPHGTPTPDEILSAVANLDAAAVRPPLARHPGTAYDMFLACLSGRPGLHHHPGISEFPAVRFENVSAGLSIELVPGCEADWLWDDPATAPTSGLSSLVFPGTRDRWLGTQPDLHCAVLDASPGGTDYPCRRLIRLLKLLKYRRHLPIRSYFIELFTLRWIEGSHDLPATSLTEILKQMQGRQPYVHAGPLSRDLGGVLQALLDAVRSSIRSGSPLVTVDLGTPEMLGETAAFSEDGSATVAEAALGDALAAARQARAAEDAGDLTRAIAGWRHLLEPAD